MGDTVDRDMTTAMNSAQSSKNGKCKLNLYGKNFVAMARVYHVRLVPSLALAICAAGGMALYIASTLSFHSLLGYTNFFILLPVLLLLMDLKAAAKPMKAARERSAKTYKGVRMRTWGTWVSEVRIPKTAERIWLGSFNDPIKDARAYDIAMYCLRGDKGKFNFPNGKRPSLPPGSLSSEKIKEIAITFASSLEEPNPPPSPTQAPGNNSPDSPYDPLSSEMESSGTGIPPQISLFGKVKGSGTGISSDIPVFGEIGLAATGVPPCIPLFGESGCTGTGVSPNIPAFGQVGISDTEVLPCFPAFGGVGGADSGIPPYVPFTGEAESASTEIPPYYPVLPAFGQGGIADAEVSPCFPAFGGVEGADTRNVPYIPAPVEAEGARTEIPPYYPVLPGSSEADFAGSGVPDSRYTSRYPFPAYMFTDEWLLSFMSPDGK